MAETHVIEKIREGIDQVDYVGVILSSHSVDSPWVKKEVDIAMNQEIEGRRVKVLPLLLEDCELPGFIKGKLYADFRNPKSYHTEFAKVANRLGVSVSGAPPNTDHFSSNAIRQIFQSWGKIAAYVFGIISIVVIITYWFNLQSLFINDTALREHVGYLSNLRKHFNKIPNPDFNLNLTNRELDYYWIDEIYTGTTWAEVFRKI
ncbi:MAG: toll/interleukin-1 receptor domain-containing protein, partial [Candidatus Brocadiaceae bacterium]|nr:toll/interleukin-1 receptor domain-containing protein [Candidatus Brocadiaceae bacterium]